MESEYIFGTESEGAMFGGESRPTEEASVQVAALPEGAATLLTPILPHDAAQVVVTPGQNVVHVPVTPGEVIQLPFGPDAHFLAKLGDGNLAIKVGDVVVILQGYGATGENPPVIESADGKPLDIATLLAETDPTLDIQTAAGPGAAGGQGADNNGAIFQQLGDGPGLGGFAGAGGQDDTSGPNGGPGVDGGPLLRTLADTLTNTAPTVSDFGTKTDEDTALKGQLTGVDPDGDPLTFHTTGAVPAGVTVNPDGTWSFDPTGNYDYLQAGEKTTITFQYQANDGTADSNTATATIEIDGLNDKASISGKDTGAVIEDSGTDATGTLTVKDLDHDQSHTKAETNTASDNGYGTWSVDGDGNWSYHLDDSNKAVNELPKGATLTDTFTVESVDGTASQTVTITITGSNDKATISGTVTGDVYEDGTLVASGQVIVTDPDKGEAHTQFDLGSGAPAFLWGVDTNGNWAYILNDLNKDVQGLHTGETLTDTFTVTSQDGTATQDITITIHGKDDQAFIFGTDSGKVTEDSGKAATGTLNVIDLDKGDAHTQTATNAASKNGYGTFSVDADGHWSYKLDDSNATVNALPAGAKLTDSFTVTSLDGSASKTVTITITGANDAPHATDATAKTNEDTAISGNVTATDPDGNPLTYSVVGGLPAGVTFKADGTWTFDPTGSYDQLNTDHPGQISFQYKANDGKLDSNVATVTIDIDGVNDAPKVTGGTFGFIRTEDSPNVTEDVTFIIKDPDDTKFTTTLVSALPPGVSYNAASGKIHLDTKGHYDYLQQGEHVDYTLTFKVTDEHGGFTTRDVTLTINGVNDQASISGTSKGDVTEDSGKSASGTLTVKDLDHDQSYTLADSGKSSYGTWSVDSVGHWLYHLDNTNKDVDALGDKDTLTDTFTVKSLDGSASQVVTITINGANDAPAIDSNGGGDTAKISVAENTTAVTTVHAADPDAKDSVSYSISGGADAALFNIDKTTGVLTFKSAPDYENPTDSGKDNVYDVIVQADDSHGGIDTQAIAVTVTDVAEVPPLKAGDDFIFTTETGLFTVSDAWLLANDGGNAASLKLEDVDSGANSGAFDATFVFPFFIPTPLEFAGNVAIDLDTHKDYINDTYLQNGEHTAFDYKADDGAANDIATVQVTFVQANTIDRSGDSHSDIIVGSSANEQLTGGSGNDFIDGRGGDDRIFGGNGIDSLYGGDGDDVIRYSAGDNVHGGDDSVGKQNDLSGTSADRGDVVAFSESVNLTEAKYNGQFDGIETISLKNGESGASGAQSLTISASNVLAMSDHTVTPGGVFSEHAAVRIDMDAVDQLYLSISKDGGQWSNSGKTADGAYDIFVHDTTAGVAGNSENAYVLVAHANAGNVHLNQDAP